jgi:lysophospholipase L1-like esterase
MKKPRWMRGVGMMPLLLAAGVMPAAAQTTSPPWNSTWGRAPQIWDQVSFNNQTIRQIVHTSVGGAMARVQISNGFGSAPLAVQDVHIAQRSSGASITAGTDRKLTFNGQTAVTIPPGGLMVSDPIAFTVAPFSDVAISLYLPTDTGQATEQQVASQTNYVVPGDHSGDATLANPSTTGSYFFLTNLDVQNPAVTGTVVAIGASITAGITSTSDANRRWTDVLASRLAAAGMQVGMVNAGISGNSMLFPGTGLAAPARFDSDVLAQPGATAVIYSDFAINDLGDNPLPAINDLIGPLKQLIARAQQKNVRFICATLTPYNGSSGWTARGEAVREAYNTFVRSPGNGCFGVLDQDMATRNPADPTRYLTAYDSGDHLHPSDAGYQAIGNAASLALFAPATTAARPTRQFIN